MLNNIQEIEIREICKMIELLLNTVTTTIRAAQFKQRGHMRSAGRQFDMSGIKEI